MTIDATVLEAYGDRLLVRDLSNNQDIIVHFRNAHMFSPGDFIRITFDGRMALSMPPQITATSIQRIQHPSPPPHSTPSELRATVIQIWHDSLLVHKIGTNRRFIIDYPHTSHFRVGQQINIRYETIFLNVPPYPSKIIAIDIIPFHLE